MVIDLNIHIYCADINTLQPYKHTGQYLIDVEDDDANHKTTEKAMRFEVVVCCSFNVPYSPSIPSNCVKTEEVCKLLPFGGEYGEYVRHVLLRIRILYDDFSFAACTLRETQKLVEFVEQHLFPFICICVLCART